MPILLHPIHPGVATVEGWYDGGEEQTQNRAYIAGEESRTKALSAFILPGSTAKYREYMGENGFVPGATWDNANSGNTITSWFRPPAEKHLGGPEIIGPGWNHYNGHPPHLAGYPGSNGSGCCGTISGGTWTESMPYHLANWRDLHVPVYPQPHRPVTHRQGCIMMDCWGYASNDSFRSRLSQLHSQLKLDPTVTFLSERLFVVQYRFNVFIPNVHANPDTGTRIELYIPQ